MEVKKLKTEGQVYSDLNRGQSLKDPWLAVNLSLFFPGIGQIYGQKFTKAFFWLAGELILIIFSLWSIFSAAGDITQGLIGLLIAGIVYLANILDAHLSVYCQLKDGTLEKIPRRRKNPWFAVFASRILPGLGHLYNQQEALGLFLLTASLVLFKLDDYFSSLLFFIPLVTAGATYHTYITFPRREHRHKHTHHPIVLSMVGVIFAWGLVCNYFPQWLDHHLAIFSIPSESMQPTLQIGDRIFVKELDRYHPKRGDVVVFHPPEQAKAMVEDAGEFYIKRIVGQPQEIVEIKDGKVYINDKAIEENYIAQSPNYRWGPSLVPENTYLVLGDNRNDSFDSHEWGFLPQENLVGQAYKIYWPLNRVKSLL